MAGTITVDKIQSDTSYNSTVNVVSALVVSNTATFSNTTTHTGAATFANTLSVTGATTLSSTLAVGNTTITGTLSATALNNTEQSLMTYLLPSISDGWRGIYRAGFDWWSRNQQWGGPWGSEIIDAATGTMYRNEFATGYISADSVDSFGIDNPNNKISQGFKVAETQTVAAIWLRIGKVGIPTSNFRVFIYTDTAGSPNALLTNGTATALSGKLLPASTTPGNCGWCRFVFATPPTLTGGTQFHIVADSSGANDASNYFTWAMITSSNTYPFGYFARGTNVPAWTAATTRGMSFLVELSAAGQILQASGQFDGKLAFGGDGASGVLSMSRGLCSSVPLHNLVNTTEGTIYLVGTALTKNATILDIGYGEDHDRIVLRSNVSTGYLAGSLYESGGTLTTVTATATDISSGTHSIGIYWRAKNDGADRIDIFVDGTTYSSSTSLSLDF